MKVVSTNANDTALGTGARSVRVDWLDDQFGYHVDDIVLNGTTPVSFPFSNMYRINYMHVRELGSTQQGATGDITITNPEGNVVYSIIKAGFATARQAIGTVPAGFYAYINHWQASSGST